MKKMPHKPQGSRTRYSSIVPASFMVFQFISCDLIIFNIFQGKFKFASVQQHKKENMVNYFTRACVLLAIANLTSTPINADRPKKTMLRSNKVASKSVNDPPGLSISIPSMSGAKAQKRMGPRALFSWVHEKTDIQTECKEVIAGYPEVCILVCTKVTSITKGGELVDEYSRVSQHRCDYYDSDWAHDGWTDPEPKPEPYWPEPEYVWSGSSGLGSEGLGSKSSNSKAGGSGSYSGSKSSKTKSGGSGSGSGSGSYSKGSKSVTGGSSSGSYSKSSKSKSGGVGLGNGHSKSSKSDSSRYGSSKSDKGPVIGSYGSSKSGKGSVSYGSVKSDKGSSRGSYSSGKSGKGSDSSSHGSSMGGASDWSAPLKWGSA